MPIPIVVGALARQAVGAAVAGAVSGALGDIVSRVFSSKGEKSDDEKNKAKVEAAKKLKAKRDLVIAKRTADDARRAAATEKREGAKGAAAVRRATAATRKAIAAETRAEQLRGKLSDRAKVRSETNAKADQRRVQLASDREDARVESERMAGAKVANKVIDAKLSAAEKRWAAEDKADGVIPKRGAGSARETPVEQVVNVSAPNGGGMSGGGSGQRQEGRKKERENGPVRERGLRTGKADGGARESGLDDLNRNSPLAAEARQSARDAAERERQKVEAERAEMRAAAERMQRRNTMRPSYYPSSSSSGSSSSSAGSELSRPPRVGRRLFFDAYGGIIGEGPNDGSVEIS